MGHVINPINFRLGHSRYWNSIWGLSSLNNYSQLSNLDFLILKKILLWFRLILSRNKFRFIFMLNNARILRSNLKTTLILQFYDLFTNKLNKRILGKVRRQILKNALFSARKWKKFKWFPLAVGSFNKSIQRIIFFIKNSNPTGVFYKKNMFKVTELLTKNTKFVPFFIKSKKHFFKKYNLFLRKSVVSSPKLRKLMKFSKIRKIPYFFSKVGKFLYLRFYLMRLRVYLYSNLDFIKNSLCYYLKPLISILPSNILLVGLNDLTIDAKFVSSFISYYLENRYYLMQIFKVLWVYLNRSIKNRLLYGYQIKLSGRFKKNEKAVYLVRKFGNLGRYDIKRFVDYSSSTARMRLGVTGIKVWLSLPASRDMLIKAKTNNHFTKVYLPWSLKNSIYSIPVNIVKSYISGSSLSWSDIIHSYNNSGFTQVTRISNRFNRSLLSHYSYIY